MTPDEAARRLLASERIRTLSGLLRGRGNVFVTGGSLRDHLLGVPTRDLDVVVEHGARSSAALVAAALGGTSFSLGKAPLVIWRVVAPRLEIDFWELGTSLEEDILRRDFTINALFWRLPRGPLIDLVGGLDDLSIGRIRSVRSSNLHRDPLRALRGVRLLATHPQLALTADCGQDIAAAAPALTSVARERVVTELLTLLSAPRPGRALAAAARLHLLAGFSPAWDDADRTARAARVADRLAAFADAGRGWLAVGARAVAPAVLALPGAEGPAGWDIETASVALRRFGFPAREAAAVAAAASTGSAALALLPGDRVGGRALAVSTTDLPASLAWACALAAEQGRDLSGAAGRLVIWWRRFRRRPPLLDGGEIASFLSLPPGPRRAEAVQELRLAQARGEVRSRAGALRWLRDRFPR